MDGASYIGLERSEKENIANLRKTKPYRTVLNLFWEWVVIVVLILFSEYINILPIYFLSVILIAARMHAIASLAHEAVHYLISKNKALNNFIARFFITLPLFSSLEGYRDSHLKHHRYLNTDKDPDATRQASYKEFKFPLKKGQLLMVLLRDLLGINFIYYKARAIFSKLYWGKVFKLFDVVALAFYLVLFFCIFRLDLELVFFKYWIVPYITWLQVILRVRAIAEHHSIPRRSQSLTRTTLTTVFDKVLFGPKNSNYHAEHHLFPSVPFYHLPRLHKILLENNTFRNSTHFSKGYIGVLKECTKP